ncbi:MAG: acyltransferase family protein [Oscillospiraceae bacterium]
MTKSKKLTDIHTETKIRQSNIEMLKIMAVFLIVICHCIPFGGGVSPSYYFDITKCSENISIIILVIFRYLGQIGNAIFIVCSSWFLTDSNRAKSEKILNIMADSLLFSLAYLIIFIFLGTELTLKEIIKSFFPVTFGNNWFVTCYIVFYFIHPLLNTVIKSLSQRQFFILVMLGTFVYSFLDIIHKGFESSRLIYFMLIYFIVAYIKLYMPNFSKNIKINRILFCLSVVFLLMLILLTNCLGLKIDLLSDQMLHWKEFNNPLIIIMAISLFNIFRSWNIQSNAVNTISSLSMLIYIIHGNFLVAIYLRPAIWKWIFENIENSREYVVIWSLLVAAVMFVASILIALLYKFTLKKKVTKLCRWINEKGGVLCNKIIDFCLTIK